VTSAPLSAGTGDGEAATLPILLVVACALVDADGRVLIAERPAGKSLAGLWEFPGGKPGPGEGPEASLVRELREELGIAVEIPCLAPLTFASYPYESFHLLMPLFICRKWSGLASPLEGQRLAWARPGKLRDYAMPPADAPLIPALIDLLGP
jgi:8-oxo-dGTP diphosphatase